MVSSLGLDVVTSAAAVRAGMSGARPLEHYEILDPDSGEIESLKGHPIREYSRGFQLIGRWVRIAVGCLTDLIEQQQLPDGRDRKFWQSTHLALALPVLDVARFDREKVWSTDELMKLYGQRVVQLLDLSIPTEHIALVPLGHAATSSAIQRADEALRRGVERMIVVGVDSYLDPCTLDWLSDLGRLKSADIDAPSPVGLSPGEAGACFMLESESVARGRGAGCLSFIMSATLGEERRNLFIGELNQGAGLTNVVARAVESCLPFFGDVVTDLNGEEWRARELSGAIVGLGARFRSAKVVHPASSLGDTGAASGAVGVCLATRAFLRRYSTTSEALIVSSSEYGHVATLRLAA